MRRGLFTVPDPGFEIRGGGGGGSVIQILRKRGGGGLQQNLFEPFGAQFGVKIRSATDLSRISFRKRAQIRVVFPNYAKKNR